MLCTVPAVDDDGTGAASVALVDLSEEQQTRSRQVLEVCVCVGGVGWGGGGGVGRGRKNIQKYILNKMPSLSHTKSLFICYKTDNCRDTKLCSAYRIQE